MNTSDESHEQFAAQVAAFAQEFIDADVARTEKFDYSTESIAFVDEMLDEPTVTKVSNLAGAYIFEVFRKKYGGTYKWYGQLEQPVLVIGQPDFELAFLAIEKAKGRIINGDEDNLTFFSAGIIDKIEKKESAFIV
jgi:hypothetical protein